MNAKQISDDSHEHFVGWQVVAEMGEIPYRSVYMTREKPDGAAIAWAEIALNNLARS